MTPGNSCQISYTFAPATDGPATQVISIASNDPSPGGHAITLTGVAEHSLIDITPPLIDFLDVTVGQTVVLPMDVVNPGMTFDISIFGPTGSGPYTGVRHPAGYLRFVSIYLESGQCLSVACLIHPVGCRAGQSYELA